MNRIPLSNTVRISIKMRAANRCEDCGCDGNGHGLNIHHIIPRYLDGNNSVENLILLCSRCHGKRENEQPKELFRHKLILAQKAIELNAELQITNEKLQASLMRFGISEKDTRLLEKTYKRT